MFENIDKMLTKGKVENKKIVLFGLNSSSYATKNYLNKKGYSIYAYIDNDPNKREIFNNMLENIIIKSYEPEELLKDYCEDTVILIASKYYSQMCSQLEKMGYHENDQILQTVSFYDLDKVINKFEIAEMKKLNASEVKRLQLDIMRFIKKVCEENALRYYMCGGTLLGAVRHRGYIPWDDDVDIAMPLQDYKEFIKIIKDHEQYYPLSVYHNKEEYYNFFMRVLDKTTVMKFWEYPFLMTTGVSIDVFPLFGLPDQKEEIDYFYNKIRSLNEQFISTYIEEIENDSVIQENRRKLQEKIITMMEQYEFDESINIGYLLSKYKEKEIMPSKIYANSVQLDFEGEKFNAPSGYVEYLTRLYHDYMELPPEKEQFNTHNYSAFQNNYFTKEK